MDFATLFTDFTDWLAEFAYKIVNLLPPSPFAVLDNSAISPYLPYLNWFIPFDYIVAVLTYWTGAIVIYYVWVTLLRWVKVIQ